MQPQLSKWSVGVQPREGGLRRSILFMAACCWGLAGTLSCSQPSDELPLQPQAGEAGRAGHEGAIVTSAREAATQSSRTLPEDFAGGEVTTLPVLTGLASESVPVQLASELSHLDPTQEGWQTEAFSSQALAQLKSLGHVIGAAERLDEAALDPYVAEDFRCATLRPAAMETVFAEGQFRASRGANVEPAPTAGDDFTGPHGLADALAELLAPIMDYSQRDQGGPNQHQHRGDSDDQRERAGPLHAHFKIVGVQQLDSAWATRAYVQFARHWPQGSIQQSSVWNCRWIVPSGGGPPRLASLGVDQVEEVTFRGRTATLYAEKTAGVLGALDSYRQQLVPDLEHWRDSIDWRFGLDVASPFGLAVGDANGDGLEDVLICEPGGLPNRLYLQQTDGTAVDASRSAGIDYLEPTEAALFLDLDNDGDQDLVMASGRSLLVLENEGGASFLLRDVLPLAGLTRSLCAADFNSDGRLDVYVCCYIPRGASSPDVGIALPIPMHDAENGAPNSLQQNMGSWHFEDVTAQVGLDQNNRRFSYAAAWEDFDNDGDLDLYVANDFGRNNLYRNDAGHFVDIAGAAGVEDQASGMSVTWGDYNHDGLMDLYVGNMFSSAGNRIAFQSRFQQDASHETVGKFRRFARGNSLFENAGQGAFRDVTDQAQVAMGRWAWGSLFVDVNNDSWQDLVVGNGFITGREKLDDL